MNQEQLQTMLAKVWRQLRQFYQRYPYQNILVLIILAVVGYSVPLVLVYWVALSVQHLYHTFFLPPAWSMTALTAWLVVAAYGALFIASCWLLVRLARLRLPLPEGPELTPQRAPQLFALLKELAVIRGQLPIHRVIVSSDYELDIVKTPYCIMPLWSKNTLVIGLPLLLTLPPEVYRALLARKLGQHSLFRNPLLHWLHALDSAWRQIVDALAVLGRRRAPLCRLVLGVYRAYAALYHKLVEPVVQLDGLSADRFAINVINDEELVAAIQYQSIGRLFVEDKFWPRLRKLAWEQRKYNLQPCASLSQVVFRSLQQLDTQRWLQRELEGGLSPHWGVAPLASRLAAVGHDEIMDLTIQQGSAAQHYLGALLAKLIKLIDARWQHLTMPQWRTLDDRLRREHALHLAVKNKAQTRDYGFAEWRRLVKLALRLRQYALLKKLVPMLFQMRLFRSKNKATRRAATT